MGHVRDAVLAATPAQKLVTLKTLKDSRGKPVRVLVRALDCEQDLEISRLVKDQPDTFERGLLVLTYCIREPKDGGPAFTVEDIAALKKCKMSAIVELSQLVSEVRSEVRAQAKK